MKTITYNKLVRDRIPEIIEKEGKLCVTKVLDDKTYLEMVDAKLDEELAEYHKDQNLEELADLLEVLYAAAKARGYSLEELEERRKVKEEKRGAFNRKQFLNGVIEVDEWPLNVEDRLKIVEAIANMVFDGTEFGAERNRTINETCVNIYPKPKWRTSYDRVAAIWALENGKLHFRVLSPLYERIDEDVLALGVRPAREIKKGHVYESISLKQAVGILQLICA